MVTPGIKLAMSKRVTAQGRGLQGVVDVIRDAVVGVITASGVVD